MISYKSINQSKFNIIILYLETSEPKLYPPESYYPVEICIKHKQKATGTINILSKVFRDYEELKEEISNLRLSKFTCLGEI